MKIIAKNPDAYRNYEIIEKYNAGIVLKGTEIKSIRNNNVSLKDSYAIIKKGEAYILNMYIKPYEFGNRYNMEEKRNRKLLLNRREIDKIFGKIKRDNYSLIPINLYLSGAYAKLELGLGKGKKNYDKRNDIAKKAANKDIQRAIKYKNR